ncbi:MAG TPA: ABC transporter ATP-binding protein [Bryobacteraceae bacterium]|nr:ABC transporter ATP-binding protein [Bryobacteraceae bacterium]
MIACEHLTKHFGQLLAIDDLSLNISGGICALVGPNGAGKSTLLKLLTGLLTPDRGEVRIDGLDVVKQPLACKRIIGVVPEDPGLFDSLTIKEHFELCGPIYGLDGKQTRDRMESLIGLLGLGPAIDVFLSQCSHGTRKKTALALALLHNPRFLFLDEPFEGIDPVSSKTIQDLLTVMSHRGATIFFVSHLLPVVSELATEIRMIRGGRIVWNSAAREDSRGLEELYFDLVERPAAEDLIWLGSSRS